MRSEGHYAGLIAALRQAKAETDRRLTEEIARALEDSAAKEVSSSKRRRS